MVVEYVGKALAECENGMERLCTQITILLRRPGGAAIRVGDWRLKKRPIHQQ